jgi:hypothetical protein
MAIDQEKLQALEDEAAEATRNGLELNPNKATDALFDEAVCEIYHRQQALRELA